MSYEDDYSHLPVGRIVGGYEILSVLGSGGFGVTYLARHLGLGRMDALKECLPVDFAWRRGDMTVGPLSAGKAEDFVWAKERFLLEAQTLAKFTHGNVVHVYDVFEANGTVYMPTGYIEGRDLKAWLDELGRSPTEAEMLPLLKGILDGLSVVHAGGVLHRDIKPENIYVTKGGKPVLLDFGSARQFIGGRSRSMTSVLTPGYAPPEQYDPDGSQGRWTDIYGLCATLHRCLCGESPPDGSARDRRGRVDPYEPLTVRLSGQYSESLLNAIDAGLDVDEEKRPQSVEEFGALLSLPRDPEPELEPTREPNVVSEPSAKPKAKRQPDPQSGIEVRRLLWAGLAGLVLLVLGIIFAAPEKTGSLLIRTNPTGATVEIEGLGSGTSRYSLDKVEPGRYTVRLSKEGYQNKTVDVKVERGKVGDPGLVKLEPKKLNIMGTVSVTSVPDGAQVVQTFSFGKGKQETEIGRTPIVVKSVGGDGVSYRISKDGYEPVEVSGTVKTGEELKLFAELKKKEVAATTSSIVLESVPSGAEIYQGEKLMGSTPRTFTASKSGSYRFELVKEGYEKAAVSVEVELGEESREKVELKLATVKPAVGSDWTVPDLGLKMKWISPGSFQMGSPESEEGRFVGEDQHRVTLSKGFWLGAYEVTFDEWKAYADASGYRTEGERGDGIYVWTGSELKMDGSKSWRSPGFSQAGRSPVVGVSWNDVQSFAKWLTDRERSAGRLPAGYEYGLPAEAQWEYACRAGSTGPYAGSSLDTLGWYSANSGSTTHAVGEKLPNAWGLYDMHGNVWEWCLDWHGDYPSGSVADPSGATSGSLRVFRGGGWSYYAQGCRSAFRFGRSPGFRGVSLGFRLSLVPRP